MKTQFELKSFLTENRETVIEMHSRLTEERFFSGISLKDFMTKVYGLMLLNEIVTEKRANAHFVSLAQSVYNDNVKIEVIFDRDSYIAKKYTNTVFAQNLAL